MSCLVCDKCSHGLSGITVWWLWSYDKERGGLNDDDGDNCDDDNDDDDDDDM